MKHSSIRILCLLLCTLLLTGCGDAVEPAAPKASDGVTESIQNLPSRDLAPALSSRVMRPEEYINAMLDYAGTYTDGYAMGEVLEESQDFFMCNLNYNGEPAFDVILLLHPQEGRILRSTVRMLRNDLPHGDSLCFYALPALVGVTNTDDGRLFVDGLKSQVEAYGLEEDQVLEIEDYDGYYVGIWLMEAGDMNRYEVEVFKRSDFIQE